MGTIDRFDNFHRSITVDITIDLNQQNLSIVSIVPYCTCVISYEIYETSTSVRFCLSHDCFKGIYRLES